jgi:hypothetical protein
MQNFKIACLQYKPTPITFKEKVYDRFEILNLKSKLIQQLEESGMTYMSLDMSSMIINVDTNAS